MSVRGARRAAAGGARRRLTEAVSDVLAPVVVITAPVAGSVVEDTFTVSGSFVVPVEVAPRVTITSPSGGSVVGDVFSVSGSFDVTGGAAAARGLNHA